MPSHYAHYRFGARVLPGLPADVRKSVQRFRRLFDVGLHGPDLFFYYNILWKTPVGNLGSKFHRDTGVEFFTMACRRYRLEPSEGAKAYLYGLLAHYCLDSVCHPFVNATAAEGKISHTELETEFDRFLLALDGKKEPHTFDCSRHMKLTRGECDTAARFFPTATAADIDRCVKSMAGIVKWLASPGGASRAALKGAIRVTGEKFRQFVMPPQPNPNCAHLDTELMALYDQALARYPAMAAQLTAHLTRNAPLEEEFTAAFG